MTPPLTLIPPPPVPPPSPQASARASAVDSLSSSESPSPRERSATPIASCSTSSWPSLRRYTYYGRTYHGRTYYGHTDHGHTILWWFRVPWPATAQRVLPGGRCHQNDIVREFRLFYPRYRRHDTGVAHKLPPALTAMRRVWRACLAWLQGVRQPAARRWHATATARSPHPSEPATSLQRLLAAQAGHGEEQGRYQPE